jgi:hypothetical protein
LLQVRFVGLLQFCFVASRYTGPQSTRSSSLRPTLRDCRFSRTRFVSGRVVIVIVVDTVSAVGVLHQGHLAQLLYQRVRTARDAEKWHGLCRDESIREMALAVG